MRTFYGLHWLILALGVWLFLAPMWMSEAYTTPYGPSSWVGYGFGAFVAIVAAWNLAQPRRWVDWLTVLLAIMIIVSVYALNYFYSVIAALNQAITGVLIGLAALLASSTLRKQRRRSGREQTDAGARSV